MYVYWYNCFYAPTQSGKSSVSYKIMYVHWYNCFYAPTQSGKSSVSYKIIYVYWYNCFYAPTQSGKSSVSYEIIYVYWYNCFYAPTQQGKPSVSNEIIYEMFSFPLGKFSVSTVMKVSMYCFYATAYLGKSLVIEMIFMFLLFHAHVKNGLMMYSYPNLSFGYIYVFVSSHILFLGHLSHSGDLLLWVGQLQ